MFIIFLCRLQQFNIYRLYQYFSNRDGFAFIGPLAMFKDIFVCHKQLGEGSGIQWVEVRNAVNIPQCTGQPCPNIEMNYLAKNVNSAEIEKLQPKPRASGTIMYLTYMHHVKWQVESDHCWFLPKSGAQSSCSFLKMDGLIAVCNSYNFIKLQSAYFDQISFMSCLVRLLLIISEY